VVLKTKSILKKFAKLITSFIVKFTKKITPLLSKISSYIFGFKKLKQTPNKSRTF